MSWTKSPWRSWEFGSCYRHRIVNCHNSKSNSDWSGWQIPVIMNGMVSFEIEVFRKKFWRSQQDLISIISVIEVGATAHVWMERHSRIWARKSHWTSWPKIVIVDTLHSRRNLWCSPAAKVIIIILPFRSLWSLRVKRSCFGLNRRYYHDDNEIA